MRLIRPVSVFLIAALLALLAGCGSKPLAEVNGKQISQAQFDTRLAQMKLMYEQNYGMTFDGEEGQELLAALKGEVVQQMIEEQLLLQEAKKEGLPVSSKEVSDRVQQDQDALGGEAQFTQYLKERMQMSKKEYSQLWHDQLLIRKLADKVTADIKVTPAEVEKYYEDNKEMFVTPEQVKARHILLKTEKEAEDVIKELSEGADFAKLAESKSIDETAKDNKGELGYFDQNANLVPEFKTAAFDLETGTISPQPVKTEFGYHVIQVTDRKPAAQQSFEEAKAQIEASLLQTKQSESFTNYLEKLEKNAKIVNN
jgi:parvulin-like peptidyl-prolyl isomerase